MPIPKCLLLANSGGEHTGGNLNAADRREKPNDTRDIIEAEVEIVMSVHTWAALASIGYSTAKNFWLPARTRALRI